MIDRDGVGHRKSKIAIPSKKRPAEQWEVLGSASTHEPHVVLDGNGNLVATTYSMGTARQIAALPELIAALRYITECGDSLDDRPAYHGMRAIARAAIAKAEGGS